MNYFRDLYNTVSGEWSFSSSDEERQDALKKVKAFTGARTQSSKAKLEVPVERQAQSDESIPEAGGDVGNTGPNSLDFDQTSITREPRSLEDMDTGLFDIRTSTPISKRPAIRPLLQTTGEDITEESVITGDPAQPPTVPKTAAEINALFSKAKDALDMFNSVNREGPSELPLDDSILAITAAEKLKCDMLKLKKAKKEMSDVLATHKKLGEEVKERTRQLEKLNAGLVSGEDRWKQLSELNLKSQDNLNQLLLTGEEVTVQVNEAKLNLDRLLSGARAVKWHEEVLSQNMPRRTPDCTSDASAAGDRNPVTPPAKGSVGCKIPDKGDSYTLPPVPWSTPATKVVSGVNAGRTGKEPLFKVRMNMSPSDREKYERNPAIAAMGLDAVPRLTEELTDRCRFMDFGDVRAPDAARLKAIVPKPFTGKPAWRKWLKRFQNITLANQYTNQQALVVLKEALSEGPGELALQRFEDFGDGTLKSLIEQATHVLVKIGEQDPRGQLNSRAQKPDEAVRVFGFAIVDLVAELYQGCRPDAPVVIQEATTRFVSGIRDPGCQAYLREKWEPEISMAELFDFADVYAAKKAVFPMMGAASVGIQNAGSEGAVECAAWNSNPKKVNNYRGPEGTPKNVPTSPSVSDLEAAFKDLMSKHEAKKSTKPWNGGNSNNGNSYSKKKNTKCNRCQKRGHQAHECKAPAPIPREGTETSQPVGKTPGN